MTGGRALVVGGAGAVGTLFAECLLGSGEEVAVVDTADTGGPRGVRRTVGDITAVDDALAAELAGADLVVLAVPEPVALAALPGVAAHLRPDAVLVDTLSVKQTVTRAVREHAPGIQAVGLNPMFAPALGFTGRPVAAVVGTEGPGTDRLLRLVGSWGAVVVRVEAAEHDRLAGATQALTHAAVLGFGLALSQLGSPVAQLRSVAPPPATTLLALLARITSGAPEVYWDVQHANPEAAAARKALADGVRRIADAVEGGRAADFEAVLDEVRGCLGADLAHFRDTCALLFAQA
ncbi:prephenate dehydrogenase/arogenate dehydrogenase family protein [Streptomyces sp. NPDC058442]|uniref:prephenate dehydrogenase/arogenate dehydrogenase family protein n=1 Tax=Streptomyces sp. NPDC058442 TaxID=3346503 RepID=UPI003667A057